jgi:hypothetical protein
MRVAQESGKVSSGLGRGAGHLGGLRGGRDGWDANGAVEMRQFLTAGEAGCGGAGVTRLGRHGSTFGPFDGGHVIRPTLREMPGVLGGIAANARFFQDFKPSW